VRENLRTYWRGVGERLRAEIEADDTIVTADGDMLGWVALGVARMLHTWDTGDVASKSAAGAWGAERVPDFADMLLAAVNLRAEPGPASGAHLLDAATFTDVVIESVSIGVWARSRCQPARRATVAANSAIVSSMILPTVSIDSMRPATSPDRAIAAFMSPPK